MTKPWENQPWVDSYRSAMLDTKLGGLDRVEIAKTAIVARISELLDAPGNDQELSSLSQAYSDLMLLERESAA